MVGLAGRGRQRKLPGDVICDLSLEGHGYSYHGPIMLLDYFTIVIRQDCHFGTCFGISLVYFVFGLLPYCLLR